MRNQDYKDDQKVVSFINSEICYTFNELEDFLKENNLPLRTRWAFYCLGKKNTIKENDIANFARRERDQYGGYYLGQIYYWENYLSDELDCKERIKERLKEEGIEASNSEIHNIFIKEGWDYAYTYIDIDRESVIDQLSYEHQQEMNQRYYNNEVSSYCDACQSSPCICSDRENTSTIHDY